MNFRRRAKCWRVTEGFFFFALGGSLSVVYIEWSYPIMTTVSCSLLSLNDRLGLGQVGPDSNAPDRISLPRAPFFGQAEIDTLCFRPSPAFCWKDACGLFLDPPSGFLCNATTSDTSASRTSTQMQATSELVPWVDRPSIRVNNCRSRREL